MKKILSLCLFIILLTACPSLGLSPSEEPLGSPPQYNEGLGTIYYISATGNDINSGTSPESPWKSLDQVNSRTGGFQAGDSILFKRGDSFYGTLQTASGERDQWFRYGAYGTGDKPLLIGSVQLENSSDWENHSGQIWKSTAERDVDIGFLYLSEDPLVIAQRKWSINELNQRGDFYFDPDGSDKILYLHSPQNPALEYPIVEAAEKNHIIDIDDTNYVLFENLHITRGAAHGIGGTNNHHIIIRNCEFSFLGGGFLYYDNNRPVRYGNGIEFWGNAENNLVEANYFHDIYDTAMTNQNHSRATTQRNLFYINNIAINCGLATFELWNRPSSSLMSHIYFLNNTSLNPGFGWGGSANREDKNSFHIASYYNEAAGENLVIKNNIFYSSANPPDSEYHIFFFDEDVRGGMGKYLIDNNLWNMPSPLWAITTSNQYNTLAQWQNASGLSANAIVEDPLFNDFSAGDYSLNNQSPAINQGESTFRTEDYLGNPIAGAPDLGAMESQ